MYSYYISHFSILNSKRKELQGIVSQNYPGFYRYGGLNNSNGVVGVCHSKFIQGLQGDTTSTRPFRPLNPKPNNPQHYG